MAEIKITQIKGGLELIKEAEKPCFHPQHNPPSHMVYKPGTYRYTCPGCGKTITFEVPLITFNTL